MGLHSPDVRRGGTCPAVRDGATVFDDPERCRNYSTVTTPLPNVPRYKRPGVVGSKVIDCV